MARRGLASVSVSGFEARNGRDELTIAIFLSLVSMLPVSSDVRVRRLT